MGIPIEQPNTNLREEQSRINVGKNTHFIESSGNYIIDGKIVQGRPKGFKGARARKVSTRQPVDFLPDVAIGLKLPFNNPDGRLFGLNYLSMDQTMTNLENLLLTRKGERIMHPRFGTRLQEALFEPNTEKLRSYINTEIEGAITQWLPYILLQDVEVNVAEKPGNNSSMIDPFHGIVAKITFSLKNNRIDTRQIVIDIKAD
jgi:phage baseplate assembly protein W